MPTLEELDRKNAMLDEAYGDYFFRDILLDPKQKREVLEGIARSARLSEKAPVAQEIRKRAFLPFEQASIDSAMRDAKADNPALDLRYPRVNIYCPGLRKQKGVPFRVPRLALFDAFGSGHCALQTGKLEFPTNGNGYLRWNNWHDGRHWRKPPSFFWNAATAMASCLDSREMIYLARSYAMFLLPALCFVFSFLPTVISADKHAGLAACFFLLGIAALAMCLVARSESRTGCPRLIVARLSGIIPEKAKASIKKLRDQSLPAYILGEVESWQYDPEITYSSSFIKSDIFCNDDADVHCPDAKMGSRALILTTDDCATWYLVDKFDMVPAEQYIMDTEMARMQRQMGTEN